MKFTQEVISDTIITENIINNKIADKLTTKISSLSLEDLMDIKSLVGDLLQYNLDKGIYDKNDVDNTCKVIAEIILKDDR
jgi:hypothetical protein